MIISPKVAIEEGWITHPKCNNISDFEKRKYISPNAIDFTLDKLLLIDPDTICSISENGKTMRNLINQVCTDNIWSLYGANKYDGMSDFYVEVPEGVTCMLVSRSTFNRNGVILTSGLYDSGFKGNIGFAIHSYGGVTQIEKGTRIGQILFIPADNANIYAGGYNTQKGKHYTE